MNRDKTVTNLFSQTTQARIDAQPGVARGFCGSVFLLFVKGREKTKGEKTKVYRERQEQIENQTGS